MPTRLARRWLLGVLVCFAPTLFYFYVGEEGVFTLNAMEMAQGGVWRDTMMYGVAGGGGNGRPPLHAWVLMPLAQALGWPHVLLASRVIAVLSTLATATTLGWLAQQLWPQRRLGWNTALLYLLTVDVLFYRGWLAYADPLFAAFTLLALALGWAACARQRLGWLLLAWVAACAAMLTKALVVYGVLGVTLAVLCSQRPYRAFVLQPRALVIHAIGVALPLIWLLGIARGSGQHDALLHDLVRYFQPAALWDYVLRLASYPLEMAARLAPASVILLWAAWRRWHARQRGVAHPPWPTEVRLALWMGLLCVLPFWLAPVGGPRYVLPLYGLLVLPASYVLANDSTPRMLQRWALGLLLLASVTHWGLFPLYQDKVRGRNYHELAQRLQADYGAFPIYWTNVAAVGLSVVAELDTLRWPAPALVWPPKDLRDGIIIAQSPQDFDAPILTMLQAGNDTLLLLCRGAACTQCRPNSPTTR